MVIQWRNKCFRVSVASQWTRCYFAISVFQRVFQRHYGIAAPSAKNIRHWYKEFEEAGCLCKRKSSKMTMDFRGGSLKSSRGFFAKPTNVHPPCQPRTWHPSTNCMACVKTTYSHAIIQVAYGASSSCWRQSKA